ncbi:tyrosine-type recombinase/integrase [Streptomyces sp. TR02-1]|uniref:tyrosine-type recombinase/integrase n=1 Tax=Streptomyces sp. TR02-1 TaxID=3385977 RepID=UPI0039A117F3
MTPSPSPRLPQLAAGTEVLTGDVVEDLAPQLPELLAIDEQLTDAAAEYLANSGRARTRQTYRERFAAFANWCAQNGRVPGPPTTAANLTSYVAELRRRGVDFGTIRLTIAAVRHTNARAGYENWPDQKAALQIYADARHEQREAGRTQKSAPPIDMVRLSLMVSACPDTMEGIRDRAMFYLGYYCRARRSELARFRVGSVEFTTEELLTVTKITSKNDKNDSGRDYDIDDPAAIRAIRAWVSALSERNQGARHLPLLRRVDQWGNIGPISSKGWGLTPHSINEIVKKAARRANVDVAAAVTSQGLRAGVPTDLGALGYSSGEIREMTGDWSSTEMVERYRKIGRRRAGNRADDGNKAHALSMLHTHNFNGE